MSDRLLANPPLYRVYLLPADDGEHFTRKTAEKKGKFTIGVFPGA